MHGHDEVETILYRLEEMLSVINLNGELTFDCVMDQHTSLDILFVILVVPVRFECDRNTIPALWVNMAKAITADLNNALGHDVRLLIQVDMVLIWVVEGAHGANRANLLHANVLWHALEK